MTPGIELISDEMWDALDAKYREGYADALAAVHERVEGLEGISITIERDIVKTSFDTVARFTVPPATVEVTNGGPLLIRDAVLSILDNLAAKAGER